MYIKSIIFLKIIIFFILYYLKWIKIKNYKKINANFIKVQIDISRNLTVTILYKILRYIGTMFSGENESYAVLPAMLLYL